MQFFLFLLLFILPYPATNPEDAAGIWGDSHCDPPYKTIVNLMEHLNKTADQVCEERIH